MKLADQKDFNVDSIMEILDRLSDAQYEVDAQKKKIVILETEIARLRARLSELESTKASCLESQAGNGSTR